MGHLAQLCLQVVKSSQLSQVHQLSSLAQLPVPLYSPPSISIIISMQIVQTVSATCKGSTQNIIVTLGGALSAAAFQINITNIITNPITTNPSSTFTFSTYTSSSASATLIESQNTLIYLTATVGTLSTFSIIPSSEVVGGSSTLTVNIKANHYIPASGIVKIGFPLWNPNAASSSQLDYFQSAISCSTAYSASTSCSYSSQVLTISNGFTTQIPASTLFAITITGFTNPISTATVTGFNITTQDSSSGNIDYSTTTLAVTTAATISGATFAVDTSTTSSSVQNIVQETNNMQVTFTSPVPLNAVCSIELVVPLQFDLTNMNKLVIFGMFGVQTTLTSTSFVINTSTNTITFTSCSTYTSNSLTAYITLYNVILPDSIKTTDSLQIYISGSSGSIAQVTSGITFTASAGALTLVSATPTISVVQSTTSIAFSLKPNHNLTTASELVITFPTGYSVSSTSCSLSSTVTVNSAAICSSSGTTYTITNFLSSAYNSQGTTNLQFSLNYVVLPQTVVTLSGLVITTYIQDGSDGLYYEVDTLSTKIPFSLTTGTISATVTPASLVTSASTSYTILFTPDHQIPQSGYITITYPSQISISDTSYTSSQASSFINFPTTPSFSISSSSKTITINNGFRTSNPPAAGTSYSFTIPGITNPVTEQRTNSFSFNTFSSSGNQIDSISGGIFVTMTSASYMSSVSISLGSYVNSAVTSYTFSLTANVAFTSSNYIFISFPSDCTLPTSSSTLACTSSYTSIVKSVACTFTSRVTNGVQAIVTLVSGVSQVNSLQTFDIQINGITNPNSTAPTAAFTVNITDPSYNTINSNPSKLTITTNTPQTVSKATLTQNTTGAGQYAYYQILFYPLSDINIGGGVQITYPSQITLPGKLTLTFKSYVTTQTPSVTYDTSSRVIIIVNVFQKQFVPDGTYYLNITLYGFQNPTANIVTDSFIVQTFNIYSTSTYYYIDWAVSNLTLNSACNYPCRSCTSASASNCTACYSTSTLNKLQDGACVSSCSLGKYYDSASGSCKACDPTCLNCKNSSTQCVSCGVGNYLYLYGTSCVQSCPSGFIQDSKLNLCTQCSSPCSSCVNTTTTCTSCLQSSTQPYFYQDTYTCYASCPSGVTILQNNNCVDCDPNCKTCSGSTTYCTSCESYMKFDQVQHQCIQVCQKGLQIYDNSTGICDYCSSNCATCSGTVDTCTTCASSQVLTMENSCDTSCRNDSQIAVNGICQSCQLPCSQCKNSTSHCTKCSGDYLLYNTTCVQYCPLKYEANNGTGQCILVGLICPIGFTINEAGDGCIPNEIECKSGYEINTARTACIPEPGFPVPFPFLILSICCGLIVFGSHIRDRFFTKVITCLIALIGSQEILIYILIVCYSGQLEKYVSLILSLVGLGMLVVSNIAFYIFYKRDILKDVSFYKWRRLYPRTAKYLPFAALLVNFKLIKMLYSGFFGQESCLAQFDDPVKSFFKPLRMITYFSFIFVYIPIIIADIYIFISVEWGYQLLVLAIESFFLAILIMVLTVLEFRNASRLIMTGDEQYIRIKPKTSDGQTNVMSGLIDMDESTLIRSKVVDDDYEVQLRKRALVSILGQVGSNFLNCQKKGVDLGGHIDYCMTKFDEEKLKLRRAFSMEEIKEEESWMASDEAAEDSDEEVGRQRRYSFPLTPRTMVQVQNPQFSQTLQDIKVHAKEKLQDNVYAECKPPDRQKEAKKKKQVSRRTQTYLRELLSIQGEDLLDSDLEIVMEDEAEMDMEYAKDLIDGVIDGLSDSESGVGKGKKGKKKKLLNGKRAKEIPDFELADIMGEFEIDDLGNFIILRGDKGELLDKKERRVNRRGYLVDRFGNVISSKGQVIFKQVELDSDDEIPAPFGFEKRKKNLLNMNEDGEFKVEENGRKPGMMEDDEELIDKELKQLKKGRRKRKKNKIMPDGTEMVVEEEDDEEESSIDSLMADSPGKYQLNQDESNEDDIIDKVTRKKVPKKRGQQKQSVNSSLKKVSAKRDSPQTSARRKAQGNVPPKRINRDDTKELFPSLAIENQEQKKLYKIAESIGGLAQQFADDQRLGIQSSGSNNNIAMSQDRLDKLKQEHFRDIMNSSQGGRMGGVDSSKDITNNNQGVSFSNIGNRIMGDQNYQSQKSKQLPPKPPMEKIYGNLGDVVNYEERQIMEQLRAQGGGGASPFSSQLTSRMGNQSFGNAVAGGDRRLRGLESIYLQKFDKKLAKGQGGGRKQSKAKFRSTLNQFVDDPERLIDDGGMDFSKQNEVSLMVADKLDKLQRQYMSNTAQSRFEGYQPNTAGMQSTGGAFGRKPGSASGSIFQQDPSLEPIKKGNWIDKQ